MQPKVVQSFDELRLNFNQLTELLSSDNYNSRFSGNCLNNFILQSTVQILAVQNNKIFKDIMLKIVNEFNLYNIPLDIDLFVGFSQGSCSIIHDDPYDVLIYGLHGETIYIIDKKKYYVKPGDMIKINAGEIHQAISIEPRIILSIGIRNDKK